MMFFYFILFCAIGLIGGFLLPPKRAGIGFVVVALVWANDLWSFLGDRFASRDGAWLRVK